MRRWERLVAMDVPIKTAVPLFCVGGVTLLLSLLFCCFLWRLRRQAVLEAGFREICFDEKNRKKFANDTCPVCLEDFLLGETIAVCPCTHGFHSKCLLQWLEMRNTCPMCKCQVRPDTGQESIRLVHVNIPDV